MASHSLGKNSAKSTLKKQCKKSVVHKKGFYMPSSKATSYGFWTSVKEVTIMLLLVFCIRTFLFGLYQVPTGSMETTMLVGERFFADKLTPLFSVPKRGQVIAFNDPLFSYSKNPVVRLFQDYLWGPSNWTKRIIGVPGDVVQGKIEDGKPVVYVNGEQQHEVYANQYPLINVWKLDREDIAQRAQGGGTHRLWDLIAPKSFDPHRPLDDQPFYQIKRDRIVIEKSEPSIIFPGVPIKPLKRVKKSENGENYWNGSDEFYVKLSSDQYWVMGDNRLGSKDSREFGPISRRLIHGKIVYRIWSLDSDEAWWILDLIKHPIDFWNRVRWKRFFQKIS